MPLQYPNAAGPGQPNQELHALALAEQVTKAIEAMHDRAFTHGDIKPRNFVLHEGRAKLVDFGTTRKYNPSRPADNMAPLEGTPLW